MNESFIQGEDGLFEIPDYVETVDDFSGASDLNDGYANER